MKQIIITALLIFTLFTFPAIGSDCIDLPATGIITEDTKLCSDTYDALPGIKIDADNILLDCGTAVLRGNYQEGTGITIENRRNVTITRCNIVTYNVGVFISNSSQIHLYDNALLKNDIGLRLYNAYENLIEKHNDKSLIKPVSALVSKYNTIMLGNKNIDKDFCEVNACNTDKDMNPCEDNDFYCSPRCNPETDSDCKKKTEITGRATEELPAIPEEISAEETIAQDKNLETETQETVQTNEETEQQKSEETKQTKYLMYPIFYLIGLLIFQFIKYVKEFDREDKD